MSAQAGPTPPWRAAMADSFRAWRLTVFYRHPDLRYLRARVYEESSRGVFSNVGGRQILRRDDSDMVHLVK